MGFVRDNANKAAGLVGEEEAMRGVRLRYAMIVALVVFEFTCLDTTTRTMSPAWLPPVNIGAAINSRFNDSGPAISRDGLTLYFTSDRPGGSGGPDLWVIHRASQTASWSSPVNLGTGVNSPSSIAIQRCLKTAARCSSPASAREVLVIQTFGFLRVQTRKTILAGRLR